MVKVRKQWSYCVELILTKTILEVGFDWDTNLFGVLVVYRISYKVMANITPIQLFFWSRSNITNKIGISLPINYIK